MNYEFCEGMTHTIKKGDTLYSISRQHNVPIAMIMRANPYVDVYNLQVGETICIPVETIERGGMSANIQQQTNMPLGNDMQPPVVDNDNNDVEEIESNGDWVRYITQAGDTLQDIMDKSDGDQKSFWSKNSADRMYMLPGIAYYIYETGD